MSQKITPLEEPPAPARPQSAFFVTGGTVPPGSPSYVERQADRDLLSALLAGEFCFVLNSRQMGKSSLSVRAMGRLREAGARVAFLDLTKIGGQNAQAEQFYAGLLAELARALDLRAEMRAHYKANLDVPAPLRLVSCLREVALEADPSPVIVFVDEVDAVRSLPFAADEFFAAIRACHNARTEDPAYRRLTFCLVGSATPSDLISDTRTSPFNVGRRIELRDFTPAEAAPLAAALPCGPAALARVLHWTNGHPYLTQAVCRTVAEGEAPPAHGGTDLLSPLPPPGGGRGAGGEGGLLTPAAIDRLVAARYFDATARSRDANLADVANRMLSGTDEDRAALLDLYARVLRGRERVPDDEADALLTRLKLCGVTRPEAGGVRVRNRIYERVFDRRWIEDSLPGAELRRQKDAYRRGIVRATALSGALAAVFLLLSLVAVRNARQAQVARRAADASAAEAKRQAAEATRHADIARRREGEALDATAAAERQKRAALAAKAEATRLAGERQVALDGQKAALLAATAAEGEARREARRARIQEGAARRAAVLERVARREGARNLYIANVRLAAQAWDEGNAQTVRQLLAAHIPKKGEPDLRDFAWRYQWKQLHHSAAATYPSDGGAVTKIAFDPEGRLVTLDVNGLVRLRDPRRPDADRYLDLAARVPRLSAAALAPDGKTVAAGDAEGTLRVLNVETGRPVWLKPGHLKAVDNLAFSPDGQSLLSHAVNEVHTWDAATGRREATKGQEGSLFMVGDIPFRVDGLPQYVTSAPDGAIFAIANWPQNTNVTLVDARAPVPSRKPTTIDDDKGHNSTIHGAAFTPDGKALATGSFDGEVILWDVRGRKPLRRFGAHNGTVTRIAFSPDGVVMATGSRDTTVKLWEAATGTHLRTLPGHGTPLSALRFSPDGRTLATAGQDGTTKLWDVDKPGAAPGDGPTRLTNLMTFAYSPDGRWLATSTRDGERNLRGVALWDARTGRRVHSWDAARSALRLAFSPDSRTLAAGYSDSALRLWDVAEGREVAASPALPETVTAYARNVSSLAFSPDGALVAAGYGAPTVGVAPYDQVARVLDAATGRVLATLRGHANTVTAVAFAPDGTALATASHDGTVKIWGTDTWRERRTLRLPVRSGEQQQVMCAAFSPSSGLLAVGTDQENVYLYDAVNGRSGPPLRGHVAHIGALAFSPDGRTLASGGWDQSVKLWDVALRREIRTLRGFHPFGLSLAFSPDGNTLAAVGAGDRLTLWEAASWPEVAAGEKEARLVERRRVEAAEKRRREAEAETAALESPRVLAEVRERRMPGKARAQTPPDRLRDADWVFHLESDRGADAAFRREPDGAFRVEVRRVGKEGYNVQLYQKGVRLAAGHEYLLQFRARADRPATVTFNVQQDVTPYTSVSGLEQASLTPRWRAFRVRFQASKETLAGHSSVVFAFGGQVGTYQIADVMLVGTDPADTSAFEPGPDELPLRTRADVAAASGDLAAAARDLAEFARTTDDANLAGLTWPNVAVLHFARGDLSAYRKTAAAVFDRYENGNGRDAGNAARVAALASPPAADPDRLLAAIDRILANPELGLAPGVTFVRQRGRALILAQSGREAEAIRYLEPLLNAQPAAVRGSAWSGGYASLILAVANHRLGRAAQARRWWKESQAAVSAALTDARPGAITLGWYGRLELQAFRDSVEREMKSPPKRR